MSDVTSEPRPPDISREKNKNWWGIFQASRLYIMAVTSATTGISWEELKAGISEAFSSDQVDTSEVKKLMESYVSKKTDWEQYEHFDKHT